MFKPGTQQLLDTRLDRPGWAGVLAHVLLTKQGMRSIVTGFLTGFVLVLGCSRAQTCRPQHPVLSSAEAVPLAVPTELTDREEVQDQGEEASYEELLVERRREALQAYAEAPRWLAQHPEIEFAASGRVGWDMRRARLRAGGSTLSCFFHQGEFGQEQHWCWRDDEHVHEFGPLGFEETTLGYEGELRLSPVQGQTENWRFRLRGDGGLDRALVGRHRAVRIVTPRPVWFALPKPTFSDPRSPRALEFEPMQTVVVEPETLGPLRLLDVDRVPNQTPANGVAASENGVTALTLVAPEPIDDDERGSQRLCARIDARWRCGEAQEVPQGTHSDSHDFVYMLDGDARLLVAQRSVWEDGGDGEGSGAEGHAFIELFAVEQDALRKVGALVIGAMRWETVILDYGTANHRHRRRAVRYVHAHSPAPGGGIVVSRAQADVGLTNGAFEAVERGDGRRTRQASAQYLRTLAHAPRSVAFVESTAPFQEQPHLAMHGRWRPSSEGWSRQEAAE